MALNTKGKKTSLNEEAFIYAKRDESESEKSKWSKMNRKEKFVHFKTYYLRILVIGIFVAGFAGFLFYNDVIKKQDVVYRCAILNESAMETPVAEFSDAYTEFMKMDPKKNIASFHFYYTNTELASKLGASATSELTQVSSMIYAATLDSIIASQEDFDTYLENQFYTDLTEILTEQELAVIQEHLYIPDTEENAEKHPYGVYLDKSDVYQQIFVAGGGRIQKPLYGILFNSKNKERSKQFLYYVFPELQGVNQ